ncbi:WD40 repeat [Dillenia turbinata]|uniref:WD repeat-containing protein 76 n=1 Tax=Dillenia turbinata TaxID=194707 RepID=A0AAN8ZQK9_9MAGN
MATATATATATERMTEYERRRLENIKRNDEMMASLNIRSRLADLSASSKRLSGKAKSPKTSPKKKPKVETPVVVRRSLRARGMPPETEGSKGSDLESPFPNADSKIPISRKHSPRKLGPISMKDAYEDTTLYGSTFYKTFVETITGFSGVTQLNPCIVDTFEGKKEEVGDDKVLGYSNCNFDDQVCCKKEVKEEKVLGSLDPLSLDLKPENVVRITSGRIMAVKFFPSTEKNIIVTGDKLGQVGFWNVGSGDEEGRVSLFRPHSSPVSGISVQPFCLSKILTSSYDGLIRLMDVEKEVFELVYSSDDAVFSLCQQEKDSKSFYFSEGHGKLNIWDERAGKVSASWVLHEDRINSIDFNSQNRNFMVTSSTDGTACIWDLRKTTTGKQNSFKTIEHKRAVHSAYFSPSGGCVATTSFDNNIGLLTGTNYENLSMIYHNNHTGRWISSFRAIWGWDDFFLFIGNMKRGVDVISAARRNTAMTLWSPLISAIPCRFAIHPLRVGMLAGATSGGQVYMWVAGDEK